MRAAVGLAFFGQRARAAIRSLGHGAKALSSAHLQQTQFTLREHTRWITSRFEIHHLKNDLQETSLQLAQNLLATWKLNASNKLSHFEYKQSSNPSDQLRQLLHQFPRYWNFSKDLRKTDRHSIAHLSHFHQKHFLRWSRKFHTQSQCWIMPFSKWQLSYLKEIWG